jgi:endonuclease/exonuclease/phosphatase (EEP) superfamily protein YafD
MRLPRLSAEAHVYLRLGISLAVGAYLLGLAAWLALWQLAGDATWWLFLINVLAVYLFVPLPLAIVLAAWRRNVALLGGCGVAVVVFAVLWGGLFWPDGRPEPEGPTLTVMTYNMLAYNPEPEGVIETIRESDADIVGILELSPRVAELVERDLTEAYPYRLLVERGTTTGGGIISRYPIEAMDVALDDPGWIGAPLVAEVDFDGERFVLVNAHSASGSAFVVARERQARLLSDFAAAQQLPVIVMGDFNALDTNESYGILTEHLYDAWREAGNGLGNTFPGVSKEDAAASKRPEVLGIDVPKWLLRIDYVFCSYEWQPIEARIGPWDGGSDHRPVIAEVALRVEGYHGP